MSREIELTHEQKKAVLLGNVKENTTPCFFHEQGFLYFSLRKGVSPNDVFGGKFAAQELYNMGFANIADLKEPIDSSNPIYKRGYDIDDDSVTFYCDLEAIKALANYGFKFPGSEALRERESHVDKVRGS